MCKVKFFQSTFLTTTSTPRYLGLAFQRQGLASLSISVSIPLNSFLLDITIRLVQLELGLYRSLPTCSILPRLALTQSVRFLGSLYRQACDHFVNPARMDTSRWAAPIDEASASRSNNKKKVAYFYDSDVGN